MSRPNYFNEDMLKAIYEPVIRRTLNEESALFKAFEKQKKAEADYAKKEAARKAEYDKHCHSEWATGDSYEGETFNCERKANHKGKHRETCGRATVKWVDYESTCD